MPLLLVVTLLVASMFGKDYRKEYIEQRSGEYDVTLADYSHAEKLLGWIPTRNIEDYMEKYINETNFIHNTQPK